MGADWVPARPLPGVRPADAAALFAEHTRLARAAEESEPGGPDHAAAQTAFEEADDRLLEAVELAVSSDVSGNGEAAVTSGGAEECGSAEQGDFAGGIGGSTSDVSGNNHRRTFRVAAVAESPVLPPRWRREAWGSLTPEEAARSVDRWRTWTDWVGEGRIPHYTAAMRTRERGRVLLQEWDRATELAESTRGLPHPWAGSERLARAREALPGLEPPLFVPAEARPPERPEDDRPEPNEFWLRPEVDAFARNLAEACREYDRCVPRRWRAGAPPREPEPGDDPWLAEFLDWAQPFTDDGWGLYLWR